MPIGAVPIACATLFTLVEHLSEELGVNTIYGASNVSFGLADRPGITRATKNPMEGKSVRPFSR